MTWDLVMESPHQVGRFGNHKTRCKQDQAQTTERMG